MERPDYQLCRLPTYNRTSAWQTCFLLRLTQTSDANCGKPFDFLQAIVFRILWCTSRLSDIQALFPSHMRCDLSITSNEHVSHPASTVHHVQHPQLILLRICRSTSKGILFTGDKNKRELKEHLTRSFVFLKSYFRSSPVRA